MPTESLAPELELLNAERAQLLAGVAQVPESLRDRRPTSDAWSVAEILEHLMQVERFITSLLIKRSQEPAAEPTAPELLEKAKLTAVRAALVRDRSVKVEAPERIRPAGTLGAAAALEGLTAVRAALLEAFTSIDPKVLDGVTQRHPAVGWLTLRGWVQFVAHHEARHTAQIGELAVAWRGQA
jgi:uncharacterized damage-inducible protein DinB